jgi:hypothetical protein
MARQIELQEASYLEILHMLEKVAKYEESQSDRGLENRYEDVKATLDDFINGTR